MIILIAILLIALSFLIVRVDQYLDAANLKKEPKFHPCFTSSVRHLKGASVDQEQTRINRLEKGKQLELLRGQLKVVNKQVRANANKPNFSYLISLHFAQVSSRAFFNKKEICNVDINKKSWRNNNGW
mgnify:CR=1 FL=1